MIGRFVMGALLVGVCSTPLFAQGSPRAGSAEQQKACRNDVVKLCRGLEQAGDMEIYQCLMSNRGELSKRCREALEQAR